MQLNFRYEDSIRWKYIISVLRLERELCLSIVIYGGLVVDYDPIHVYPYFLSSL
jgi:hypothetical protein